MALYIVYEYNFVFNRYDVLYEDRDFASERGMSQFPQSKAKKNKSDGNT